MDNASDTASQRTVDGSIPPAGDRPCIPAAHLSSGNVAPATESQTGSDPGARLVSIVGKIWELSEQIFPGPVSIEYAFDPEDRSHEYIVFDVTAKGEFADFRDRFFKWHEEVEKIIPNRAGEFRLLVHPHP